MQQGAFTTCQISNESEDEVILRHSTVHHESLKLVISLGEEGVHQLLLAEGHGLQHRPQHLLLGAGQTDA